MAHPRDKSLRKAILLALALGPFTLPSVAQEPATDPPPTAGTPYVLHVYTNLVQLPTLVLGLNATPTPPVARDQFNLTVDGGPMFHPTQVRLEGGDPLTIALLLDVSGSETYLIRAVSDAVASLSPLSLKPRDHIVVFAFDCDVAALPRAISGSSAALKASVEEALNKPGIHGPKSTLPACYHTRRVWDALGTATATIAKLPGRRVIVAITDGFDHGSKISWTDLQQYASSYSVSLFGVTEDNVVLPPFEAADHRLSERYFNGLCNNTGGLVLSTSPKTLSATLQHIVELLRGRYILEFPRPSNGTAGLHLISVKIPHRDTMILSSGVTVPLAGDEELYDPNTVPSDPNRAPTQGTHKPIKH